jgi:Domain of unknown function (DUF4124)
MLRLVSITALVLAAAFTVARADVFRWIDKDGVPHYSDEWVPGSVVIKTTVRPHSESSSSSSTASTASRVNEQIANQDNARAVQQDVAKARDSQCSWAKDRYMKAIASRRVYKEGKDGERQYMSDTDADAYREQARKDVQQACGSVPEWKPDQPIAEPQPIPEPKVNPALATSE